jgi:hypothetical protein
VYVEAIVLSYAAILVQEGVWEELMPDQPGVWEELMPDQPGVWEGSILLQTVTWLTEDAAETPSTVNAKLI